MKDGQDELTQEECAQIMMGSMVTDDGELTGAYGWSYPIMVQQLINAHTELHGDGTGCEWIARHDIMRYVCIHGYFVRMYGLHNIIGRHRN